jgi:hypothetical protein
MCEAARKTRRRSLVTVSRLSRSPDSANEGRSAILCCICGAEFLDGFLLQKEESEMADSIDLGSSGSLQVSTNLSSVARRRCSVSYGFCLRSVPMDYARRDRRCRRQAPSLCTRAHMPRKSDFVNSTCAPPTQPTVCPTPARTAGRPLRN